MCSRSRFPSYHSVIRANKSAYLYRLHRADLGASAVRKQGEEGDSVKSIEESNPNDEPAADLRIIVASTTICS